MAVTVDLLAAAVAPEDSGMSKEAYAVVGALLGAVATLSVGYLNRRLERDKLAHAKELYANELRQQIKDDFFAAIESMGIIQLGEAEDEARRTAASEAGCRSSGSPSQ